MNVRNTGRNREVCKTNCFWYSASVRRDQEQKTEARIKQQAYVEEENELSQEKQGSCARSVWVEEVEEEEEDVDCFCGSKKPMIIYYDTCAFYQ